MFHPFFLFMYYPSYGIVSSPKCTLKLVVALGRALVIRREDNEVVVLVFTFLTVITPGNSPRL